jgi:hypothetical protein
MRKLLLLLAIPLLFSCTTSQPQKGVLKHVVMFKWKESATPEKLKELSELFASLPAKIDVIQGFEWGTDVSVEGLTKGYTHCYILTFASEKERDIYIPHPEHKAFGEALGPYLEDVLVVDFISKQ